MKTRNSPFCIAAKSALTATTATQINAGQNVAEAKRNASTLFPPGLHTVFIGNDRKKRVHPQPQQTQQTQLTLTHDLNPSTSTCHAHRQLQKLCKPRLNPTPIPERGVRALHLHQPPRLKSLKWHANSSTEPLPASLAPRLHLLQLEQLQLHLGARPGCLQTACSHLVVAYQRQVRPMLPYQRMVSLIWLLIHRRGCQQVQAGAIAMTKLASTSKLTGIRIWPV